MTENLYGHNANFSLFNYDKINLSSIWPFFFFTTPTSTTTPSSLSPTCPSVLTLSFPSDIFGDAAVVDRHREQLLAAASPAVREDYGEAYLSALPDTLTSSAQQVLPDISPVMDAMQNAVLATRPRPLYTPGRMAWLLPTMQRCCPTALTDALTTRIVTRPGKPTSLGRSWGSWEIITAEASTGSGNTSVYILLKRNSVIKFPSYQLWIGSNYLYILSQRLVSRARGKDTAEKKVKAENNKQVFLRWTLFVDCKWRDKPAIAFFAGVIWMRRDNTVNCALIKFLFFTRWIKNHSIVKLHV